MTWLSPAFPVGAFSYSGGLEQAVHDGSVTRCSGFAAWLEALIRHGSAGTTRSFWPRAIGLVTIRRRLEAVRELAEALAGSRERHMETTLQGEAFLGGSSALAASGARYV